MLMEIAAFLAWIELRRRMPRGTCVPGIGSLFGESPKRHAWWLQVAAALALSAACPWPELARAAGALVLLAWLHAAFVLRGWRPAMAWQPQSSA